MLDIDISGIVSTLVCCEQQFRCQIIVGERPIFISCERSHGRIVFEREY